MKPQPKGRCGPLGKQPQPVASPGPISTTLEKNRPIDALELPMASIFTRIITGDIPGAFIFQHERWVAFLDINPVNPGHALLVPRQEVALLGDLDGASLAESAAYLARIDRAIRAVTGCDALSILLRDGPAAGQEVPHLHWHLVPRHNGDRPHHFAGGSYASDAAREDMRSALAEALL